LVEIESQESNAYGHGLVAVEVDLVVLLQVLEAVGLVPALMEQSGGRGGMR
jgi:hypothetical protein